MGFEGRVWVYAPGVVGVTACGGERCGDIVCDHGIGGRRTRVKDGIELFFGTIAVSLEAGLAKSTWKVVGEWGK